jgi:mono/diheme cytochrome c family protein
MIAVRFCSTALLLLVASTASGQENPGKAAYARVCEACHGPSGKGGGQGPALVPFDLELGELVMIVRQGIGMMPAISRDQITDEEIAEVRAYLLALSHGQAPMLSSGSGSTSTSSGLGVRAPKIVARATARYSGRRPCGVRQ